MITLEHAARAMDAIGATAHFDWRLARYDLLCSQAHVAMLGAQGIVSAEDAETIARGLDQVAAEYEANGVTEDPALEDIHMHVEHRLAELIGPVAGRLHPGRSLPLPSVGRSNPWGGTQR